MRKQTPSWSISGKATFMRKDNVPGPGAYPAQLAWNAPRISIGKAKRIGLHRTNDTSPGPAAYSVYLPPMTSSVIGTSRRRGHFFEETPGPGSYNTTPKKSGPTYTLRPKYNVKIKNLSPGPGAYDPRPKVKFVRDPTCIIGRQKKHLTLNIEGPGPGAYGVTTNPNTPSIRFPTASRTTRSINASPGPGAYDLDKY